MMSVHTVDVAQFAAKWPQLLEAVEAGDEVILTERDVPQARLAPLSRRIGGFFPGDFQMADDFDEPLPDDFWLAKGDDKK